MSSPATMQPSAVEFLKDAQIAVILADQRMPKLTGGEFLAKAREISDATRILITGYVDIDALIRAVNDGQIHSYIPKPWEPANLKVTVLKAATYAKELSQRKKGGGNCEPSNKRRWRVPRPLTGSRRRSCDRCSTA